ncbi:MAG: hypothetical protein IPM94_09180 [bacterium]|nr:hypothetical protein [bacterium]
MMAITAIGVQPQYHTHPALRQRGDPAVQQAAVGDIAAVPEAEQAAAHAGDEGDRQDHPGRSHVQQTLHDVERSVRLQLRDALDASSLDDSAKREILKVEKQFRGDLAAAFRASSDGGEVDPSSLAEGVRTSLESMAAQLHFTLEALLPPVPWEAEMPPEPEAREQPPANQPVAGGLDLLA